MTDHVAVLIVGYRCASEIRRCLETLSHSMHTSFEVQICENGGSEAYAALLQELAQSAIISHLESAPLRGSRVRASHVATLRLGGQRVGLHSATQNFGYAGGVNAALDQIIEPGWSAIWILNPDTEVHPEALGNLVAHGRRGQYGVIGCRLVLAETGRIQLYGGRWRKWIGRGFNLGLNNPADVSPDIRAVEDALDYVSGAAMFVTRHFVDAIGRMDERYFLYNEEVDWCFRRGAFRLGYAHDAIVHHKHGATLGSSHDRRDQSPLSVYLDERNKLLFTKRFFRSEYPVVLIATLLLTGQYLSAGAFQNFTYALKGWWAGLIGCSGRPDLSLPMSRESVAAPLLQRFDP